MATEKENNIGSLVELAKLRNIMKAIGDRDPKEVEDEYFSKFGCHNEKHKIEFEARYIRSKFKSDRDEYKKKIPEFESKLKSVEIIIESIDEFRPKDFSRIKEFLVLLELKADLNIGLVTTAKEIYERRMEKLKIYNDIDYIIKDDKLNINVEHVPKYTKNKNDNKREL
jgi:hypothetical protein